MILKNIKTIFNKSIGVLGFLIIWELASIYSNSPAFPSLKNIFVKLIEVLSNGNTIIHITSSLKIVTLGILFAIIIGFILGMIMVRFKVVNTALLPLIEMLRGVAALTLFPLLIVTLGMGDSARIFVIFWTAWASILISTIKGLSDIEQMLIEAAQNLGANENIILFKIRLPLALPQIVNGIRIGISGGWISLIAAEMLGATKGIGYALLWASQSFDFNGVYAYIIIIAVLGGLMNWAMLIIQKNIEKRFLF